MNSKNDLLIVLSSVGYSSHLCGQTKAHFMRSQCFGLTAGGQPFGVQAQEQHGRVVGQTVWGMTTSSVFSCCSCRSSTHLCGQTKAHFMRSQCFGLAAGGQPLGVHAHEQHGRVVGQMGAGATAISDSSCWNTVPSKVTLHLCGQTYPHRMPLQCSGLFTGGQPFGKHAHVQHGCVVGQTVAGVSCSNAETATNRAKPTSTINLFMIEI